jgi:hypothetical protein
LQQEAMDSGLEIVQRPYPASAGLPVRSFELTGVCAFASGDAARDARLMRACANLHDKAQDVLGSRGIWQDGALWPASLDAHDYGATLRSLFCTALTAVIEERTDEQEALARVQAAMDALPPMTREVVRRLGWRQLCISENQEADRANFRMVYESLAERKTKDRAISPELRARLDAIMQDGTQRIRGHGEPMTPLMMQAVQKMMEGGST